MFEFKAFTPSSEEVAGGKVSTQSSTFKNKSKFTSSKAVDGDALTFSHTNDSSPFWEVDLGVDVSIGSVQIENRWCESILDAPRCLCRMSMAKLVLLDSERNVIKSMYTGDTCGKNSLDFDFSHVCGSEVSDCSYKYHDCCF